MSFRSNDAVLISDADVPTFDAFGRIRSSSPATLFESSNVQGSGLGLFAHTFSAGGPAQYVENLSAVQLSVTSASGSRALRQSREYIKYSPGKSQLFMISSKFNSAKSNLRQMCGAFDDNNGIFFLQEDSTYYFVLRSNTSGVLTERKIPQSEWNIDKLDGSGESKFNLNAAKGNIYIYDFQWLGVGQVRCGVESQDGELIYAHSFKNANNFDAVYMVTPNLPVRWEIANKASTSSASTLNSICSSVQSEGGESPIGISVSADTDASTVTVNASETAVLAVRLKQQSNRASLIPVSIECGTVSNSTVLVRAYICNESIAGTYMSNGENTEKLIAPGAIPTNKIRISSFYVNPQSRAAETVFANQIKACADYAGTTDTILVTAQTFGGNASMYSSIKMRIVK